jgi:hypothetical protein
MSLSEKDKAFVRYISSTKKAWDALTDLFIGNASIQESKFDEANNEADNFAILDGEDPQEIHRSILALQVKLINPGATQCDWRWMRRKFVQAIWPFMKDTINSIKGNAGYRKMTAHDILHEIVATRIAQKNADDALARAHGVHAPNLALKANVSHHEEASVEMVEEMTEGSPEDTKYAYAEHMALAQRTFMKKWKSTSPSNADVRLERNEEIYILIKSVRKRRCLFPCRGVHQFPAAGKQLTNSHLHADHMSIRVGHASPT